MSVKVLTGSVNTSRSEILPANPLRKTVILQAMTVGVQMIVYFADSDLPGVYLKYLDVLIIEKSDEFYERLFGYANPSGVYNITEISGP